MRFRRDPKFDAAIRVAPDFHKGMAGITAETAASIKAAAEPFRKTGDYASQIGPVPERLATGEHRIALPRHIWHIVELGSVNNAPQANVLRGVRAVGLRYVDDGPQQG